MSKDMLKKEKLEEQLANELVEQRAKEYGDPIPFFQSYEIMCEALDGYQKTSEMKIPGCKITLHLIALKMLRLAYNPTHEDSLDDLEGYTLIFKRFVNNAKKTK